ncbi:MAG TPA: hypothetical protein DCO89_02995 [Clostridiales bacterium]|nr:hypothetical protein [Clostridiales bacterium]
MTAKSKNNEHIKIIPQPFNYSFTLMFEEYPEQFIEVLKAPGKFVKKANTQVKLPDGKTGEMDCPYIADPDYKTLFERVIVIMEHQRLAVTLPKNIMISNYAIQGVADEKLPFYALVASHIESSKHHREYDRTASFIIRLQFLDLGERDNWERLNSVRNKLKFNKKLSVKAGLNLGIAAVFAPEHCAKERTREALHYYQESEIASKKLEYVLYSVLNCMIDAYFDEEKEYQRMIKMLKEKTSPQTKEKYAMEIRQEKRLKQAYSEIDEITIERDNATAERDDAIAKNDQITAERDEAYEFIRNIMPEFEDSADEGIKKKIIHFKRILQNSNA